MQKDCVFTIVAKNYIGLGEILGKTLHRHNPEIDFKIIVADEFDNETQLPDNTLIARSFLPYSDAEWRDMTFKYNLTEFCTAIKPAVIKYLFSQGYDRVIYFDPDIYIFSPIDELLSDISHKDLVLVPHVAGIHKKFKGDHDEWHINLNGIYNLGFIGIKNTQKNQNILSWWEERLRDQCFNERTFGQFTDQKWMDWIPGILNEEEIMINRNLGLNVAPWNFFEREIVEQPDGYYVKFREEDSDNQRIDKLIFIHYSGFDYTELKKGKVKHKRLVLSNYPDFAKVFQEYGIAIKENATTFDKFIDLSYSYGKFDNGIQINEFHRRLFHGLSPKIRLKINPFLTGENSFFSQLKKGNLIDIKSVSSITHNTIENIDKKRRILNRLYKFLFHLLGFRKYVALVKSCYSYCLPESHTFLMDETKIKI